MSRSHIFILNALFCHFWSCMHSAKDWNIMKIPTYVLTKSFLSQTMGALKNCPKSFSLMRKMQVFRKSLIFIDSNPGYACTTLCSILACA